METTPACELCQNRHLTRAVMSVHPSFVSLPICPICLVATSSTWPLFILGQWGARCAAHLVDRIPVQQVFTDVTIHLFQTEPSASRLRLAHVDQSRHLVRHLLLVSHFPNYLIRWDAVIGTGPPLQQMR